MAMTKKEREALQAVKTEAALSWPRYAEPTPVRARDLPTVEVESQWSAGRETVHVGWSMNPHYGTARLTYCDEHRSDIVLTDRVSAATGLRKISSSSRAPSALYASEVDALKAAQWARCREVAAGLRKILDAIEAAEARTNGGE